jgi:hypothetical protein
MESWKDGREKRSAEVLMQSTIRVLVTQEKVRREAVFEQTRSTSHHSTHGHSLWSNQLWVGPGIISLGVFA